jgi:hypothetical protein
MTDLERVFPYPGHTSDMQGKPALIAASAARW